LAFTRLKIEPLNTSAVISLHSDALNFLRYIELLESRNYAHCFQVAIAGEFHFIGKEASTRWASGVDLSMLADAEDLDLADETSREYERVVDPKYLDQIRTEATQFSNKLLSRQSGVARSAIMNFKKGRNTIKPRTLRKLTKAIHDLQNRKTKD
jgi:hypothetical protein